MRLARSAGRSLAAAAVVTVAGLALLGFVAQALAGPGMHAAGFPQPFAGTPRYERYAPTETTRAGQVNRPLGLRAAGRIARRLGLQQRLVFTARQRRLFLSGRGVGGDPAAAKLADESVLILTNTRGRPLYARVNGRLTRVVLGSYGLTVNRPGMLQSPANSDEPTRQVNELLVPGGYLSTWCRDNGAEASLRMLYRSAYFSEAVYGLAAQLQSGAAQLVPNQKGATGSIVGMSMAPALWIVNFALIYALDPRLAAKMPAYWTPIPAKVALAIAESPTGQVPYGLYASSFGRTR